MHMQGDLKYMHSCTAVCHGRNAILILFLRHFEAHTLPFRVRFQHRPGLIAHFWNLEHRLNIFPLRSQQKQRQKYLEFVVTGQVCVALIDILPFWLNPTKNKSHGVRLGLHGGNLIFLHAQSTEQETRCRAVHEQEAQNVVALVLHLA